MPFRGDRFAFAILSAAFLSAIGTGVLVASAVRTLEQTLLVSFFVLFPVPFLSGTVASIESMPLALQWLSRVLWPQLLWMLFLGTVWFAGSAALFRRRLA